ncbi:zinc fingers and homeoboxes protein 1-like [Siphateles boraxobius]|uniref:zinc fingers and homeoboxes protein 1-like n=1 Tax=Siphateles boraxobius TaxID=180520 RepID=UPI004064AB73
MSSQRKPCVLNTTGFNPEDSVEMDVSVETVLDRCDPVPPPTDESRMALNDEEEEKNEGVSSSEKGSFYTRNPRNYRDHEDFHRSEGPFCVCTFCKFSTNNFESLSCHNKVQHPNESCSKFRETVDCKNDGSLLEAGGDTGETPKYRIFEKGLEVEKDLYCPVLKNEIRGVSVNGTIIIPEPVCHVTPLLQRPPNLSNSPTIAVPLHTSKYNPILDSNPTLITCFSRFPYPTHSEFSWLTSVSRVPEEQIKVWFSTQRLKQGITWTPEEVEEARKKMFNGSIPTPQHTCVASPTPEPTRQTSPASNSTANISSTTSTALRHTLKHSLGTPLLASELKRPVVHMPPLLTSSPEFPESKPSSPASFVASNTKRPFAYCVPPKGNLPIVQFTEKMMSKERLPLSPIVSTNLKRSLIHHQINNRTSASTFIPKNKLSCFGNGVTVSSSPAQVNRPTIIQTLSRSPTPVLQFKSTKPPMLTCFSSQNDKEIPHGDVKHWFLDHTTNSQNSCVEFGLVPAQLPLLKDKSPGQIKLLEESFQRKSFPSYNEVEHLMITTRLSREELESWFSERRALRDYLEQALLNSMGSRQDSQQPVLNGSQRSGTRTGSPVAPKSKYVNRVKNLLVQSQLPSPVEFRRMEMQTQLARTELIQWFRDSRLAQQSCVLDRKEVFGERNGCRTEDYKGPKDRPLREEIIKPSSPEIENRFSNTLAQHMGNPETKNRFSNTLAQHTGNPETDNRFSYTLAQHTRNPETENRFSNTLTQHTGNPEIKNRFSNTLAQHTGNPETKNRFSNTLAQHTGNPEIKNRFSNTLAQHTGNPETENRFSNTLTQHTGNPEIKNRFSNTLAQHTGNPAIENRFSNTLAQHTGNPEIENRFSNTLAQHTGNPEIENRFSDTLAQHTGNPEIENRFSETLAQHTGNPEIENQFSNTLAQHTGNPEIENRFSNTLAQHTGNPEIENRFSNTLAQHTENPEIENRFSNTLAQHTGNPEIENQFSNTLAQHTGNPEIENRFSNTLAQHTGNPEIENRFSDTLAQHTGNPEIEHQFSNTLAQHKGNIGEAFGDGSEDFGVSDSS